jgi:hypothetical protein
VKRLDSILKTLLLVVIPGAIAIASPGDAQAQPYVDVSVAVEPPDAYIATVQPEYYEGRPVYYYNNYWYYRDRVGHWGYYRAEPVWLRDRRAYWVGRGYAHYRPEYWQHRGGYVRGGYVRGGYERPVHGGYVGRYHYRR